MKNILLIVILALIQLAQSAFAAEEPLFSGSISTGPQHGYVGRRVARNLYDDWMMWSDLHIDHRSGIFLDLWNSTQLDRRSHLGRNGNEFDVCLGWHGSVKDWFDLEVSSTLFDLDPIDQIWYKDVALQSLSVSKLCYKNENHTIKSEMRVEWISKTDDFHGGALVLLPALHHNWKAVGGLERLSLDEHLIFAHDDGFNGPKNSSRSWFIRWVAGLNWKLGERLTLTFPSGLVQRSIVRGYDGRDGWQTTYGASLALSF